MTELSTPTPEDIERLDSEPELYEAYVKQADEWQLISNELIAARPGHPVTAYQVSLEQRKRWLAHGERPWWEKEKG